MKVFDRSRCDTQRYSIGWISSELKALADFVASSVGVNDAFIEKKFHSPKAGELWLFMKSGLESPERVTAGLVFSSRKRDMGMIGASFSDESAMRGHRDDCLLKPDESRCTLNVREENGGAIKEVQRLNPQRNGLQSQFAYPRHKAGVLFLRCISQKLQSNVPGFGRGPAQPVVRRAKSRDGRGEFICDSCRQRNAEEQAHSLKITTRAGQSGTRLNFDGASMEIMRVDFERVIGAARKSR
ncbi:MAG: hypothetical protein WBD10_12295 [Acidobacteriaceae bacterium]